MSADVQHVELTYSVIFETFHYRNKFSKYQIPQFENDTKQDGTECTVMYISNMQATFMPNSL